MIIAAKTYFRKIIIFLVQLVLISILKVILLPWIQRDMKHLASEDHYLIAANHRRMIDAFAITAAIPYRVNLRLLPYALITANVFYDSWAKPLLWILGCYPARNPRGNHSLYGVEASAHFLRQKYSVAIFPEGKRIRGNGRGAPYPGVTRIQQAAPEVPLALCHIEFKKGWRPICIVMKTADQRPLTPEKIMDEIYAL